MSTLDTSCLPPLSPGISFGFISQASAFIWKNLKSCYLHRPLSGKQCSSYSFWGLLSGKETKRRWSSVFWEAAHVVSRRCWFFCLLWCLSSAEPRCLCKVPFKRKLFYLSRETNEANADPWPAECGYCAGNGFRSISFFCAFSVSVGNGV